MDRNELHMMITEGTKILFVMYTTVNNLTQLTLKFGWQKINLLMIMTLFKYSIINT